MDKGTIDERLAAITNPVQVSEEPKVVQPEAMPATEVSSEPQITTDSVSSDDLTLPEDSSQRTKEQFEKLKTYLSKEKQEKEELKKQLSSKDEPKRESASIFDELRPNPVPENQAPYNPQQAVPTPYLNPSQTQNLVQQFVDNDGNVDLNALNKALSDANRMAYEANQRSMAVEQRNAQVRQDDEVREAHSKFPEVDPNSKTFDKNFYEMVRDRMVRNLWEGKGQRFADVVNELKNVYKPNVNKDDVRREVVQEQAQRQQARNQGPFEQGGAERSADKTQEELRAATRRGDGKALDARLRALGI